MNEPRERDLTALGIMQSQLTRARIATTKYREELNVLAAKIAAYEAAIRALLAVRYIYDED